MKTNDGGPAFPTDHARTRDYTNIQGGMSLHDWFAGTIPVTADDWPTSSDNAGLREAYNNLMERECLDPVKDLRGWFRWHADLEAIVRGIKSDAMLAQREKGTE